MVWYSHLLKNFPQFILIHTVKGFGIVGRFNSDLDWKRSVFIPIPKKGNGKECTQNNTIAFISYASKVMFKIL